MSISRRSFLKTALTASGTLMIYAVAPPLAHAIATKAFALPFLEMDENGGITYISYRSDMGQGSPTGQAQMLFDEMDADWNKLVAVKEGLAIDRDYYQDGLATVGAVSTFLGWKNHRRTGANLREGFKISAAGRWQVPSERLTT